MTATPGYLQGLSDNIVVDPQKCTFCGICVERCILDNLRLKLALCRQACPLHTNCQGYVRLIARGDDRKATKVISDVVPFIGILGRICSHQCETSCTRLQVDGEAVAIRDLKRYLADNVELPPVEMAPERSERVAIIGAGPAGAYAAYLLRQHGFRVEIFDASPGLGGMLATAVPEFRLPAAVLDKEMGILEGMGIVLHLGVRVGTQVTLPELAAEFAAVLIATGAQKSKALGIAGEDLKGVWAGLDFLRSARSAVGKPAVGRAVAVIGGGNTAVDAAQTALRLGAQEVKLICLESRAEMPAFQWEVADACEEGVEIVPSCGPIRFLGRDGQVSGIQTRRCLSVFDAQGRFAPCFDDGQQQEVSADTVIVAIGQTADMSFLDGAEVAFAGSQILCDPLTLQCRKSGDDAVLHASIFAAGDIVTGPKTVVEALASGREAAESIRRYLCQENLRYGRAYPGPYDTQFDVDLSKAVPSKRVAPNQLPVDRRRSFLELVECMSEGEARAEAERCLSCGEPYGKFRTCWYCLPCEVECPEEALRVEIPYLLR